MTPRAARFNASATPWRYLVKPPAGRGITVSMSWLLITASHSSDSISGRASPDGIGVTVPTHKLAIAGVRKGSTIRYRLPNPATSA